MTDSVQVQVEALRQKLLDLSLRNRMLNFRPSKRVGIIVAGEDSVEVHRIVVEESRKMSFVGVPDPPKETGARTEPRAYDDPVAVEEFRREAADELNAYLENPYATVIQTDTKLNTEEWESLLQAKLRTIQREAHLANEELGIDTLFLTLGMLEWREPGADRAYRAPLLFVPVTLERQGNGSMRLVHAGGDVGDNLPLRAKLRELNVRLPGYDDEQGVAVYWESVRSATSRRGDWKVLPHEMTLGFFNYEKYVMYVDLGGEAWPADRKPWMDPDVAAMLGAGYETPDSPVGDRTFLDDVRPVARCHEVYDADSSQTLAMLRAEAGISIVIEGPPGTGKSQTITNIIAEAVEAGKKVLFVSAKRAALEVVKRRLDHAGLGAICLDLHDKLTNRREFYGELKRTADLSLSVKDEGARVERLTELRDRLNAHAAAVNEPLPEFGCTPFEAMVRLAALPPETPEDRAGRIEFGRLRHWTEAEIRKRIPAVEAMQARLGEVGVPAEHPFWGVGIEHVDPGLRLDLVEDLGAALKACEEAAVEVACAAEAMRIPAPATWQDVAVLRRCAERVLDAPRLDGVAVQFPGWAAEEPRGRDIIARLRRRSEILARRSDQVAPDAWERDWAPELLAYESHAGQWYRLVFAGFRRARRELDAVLSPAGPKDAGGRCDLLRDLVQERWDREAIRDAGEVMTRLFGDRWNGGATDASALERLLDWVLRLHADVSAARLPASLIGFVAGGVRDPALMERVEEAERVAALAGERYGIAAGHLRVRALAGPEPIAGVTERVRQWLDSLGKLPAYLTYAVSRRQAVEQGLDAAAEVADRWPGAAERLSDAYLRSYYEGVMRDAIARRPALRTWDREAHEQAIREYRSLDDFKLAYNRARVRLAHQRRLPSFSVAAGNLLILRQQCELLRRHKPIRWAMARAGDAIMHIKPVFMMSPLSVAIHLPPEMPAFDMVIFDEASQVRPEDALCAIIRGRQTVVVGDTRQLPPTSFFDRVADDEEPDEDAADVRAEIGHEAAKLESILSMMSSVTDGRVRRPDLRWHYRSLHPALIQPSNEMFYDNRLIVFPSADHASESRRLGVVFHHLPDAVYEGGERRRINRGEAERIVDAIAAHVRDQAEESLMVAAMNKPQSDLIYEMLLVRERQDPEAFSRFAARHPHEPLEVKNLENVQGDERDVVFISVTYGRDASGVIRQQFGPLLRDGGERRLNVLITRARRRCEVFSALRADDLRVEGRRTGLAAFQSYLRAAETGILYAPSAAGADVESPFEEEVRAELRGRGYEVDAQVGSEGYRVDLAVIDPEAPGRCLLGIECDGVTYHSARSARDRDKLRQHVLEARGWRLHRIWSCDWWQDREGEIERLVRAIQGEPAEPPPGPAHVGAGGDLVEIAEGDGRAASANLRPYTAVSPFVGSPDSAGLGQFAAEVVAEEGPISHSLLLLRLRDAAGYDRIGSQRRAELEEVLTLVRHAGLAVRVGDDWMVAGQEHAEPRDWSTRPAAEKKAELVPEIEIAAALRRVIANAFGIDAQEAARQGFALLGFQRVAETTRMRGEDVLRKLVARGAVVERNGCLWPQEVPPSNGAG